MNFQTRKLCILYTISLQLVSCMMYKIWQLLEIATFPAVLRYACIDKINNKSKFFNIEN